jgi:hypothetical protein
MRRAHLLAHPADELRHGHRPEVGLLAVAQGRSRTDTVPAACSFSLNPWHRTLATRYGGSYTAGGDHVPLLVVRRGSAPALPGSFPGSLLRGRT